MTTDLLARIAKAMETPLDVYEFAQAADKLLPEAHAALKIAVEALQSAPSIEARGNRVARMRATCKTAHLATSA